MDLGLAGGAAPNANGLARLIRLVRRFVFVKQLAHERDIRSLRGLRRVEKSRAIAGATRECTEESFATAGANFWNVPGVDRSRRNRQAAFVVPLVRRAARRMLHQQLGDGAARFVARGAADSVNGDDSDASTHSALLEGGSAYRTTIRQYSPERRIMRGL